MMSWIINYLESVDYIYFVVLSGNILALTGDAAITWPSPILPKLNSDSPLKEHVTEDQLSWIASVSGYGSLVSLLPFCVLPDMIGRKPCLLFIAIPHMISFGLAAFATEINMLYISRFLSGFSTCSCYTVLPMYVAEISENSKRGLMLVSFAIFSNFGSLLSYLTGPYMSMFWFNILLLCFPICFFVSFLLIAPESPYYHIIKRDEENALKVLRKMRNNKLNENPEDELERIKNEVTNTQSGAILKTLLKKHAIKGSFLAMMLTSFQQLSGYAVFLPYTQQIFIDAGTNIDSAISSIIVGCVAFLASFLCPFIIDTRGRRFVLFVSISGIIISEIIFGAYYYSRAKALNTYEWIPLFCLMLYMLFYTLGLGPLPLTVTSEILPINVKFIISTISGFLGSISSIVLSKNYFYLNQTLGHHGTFWLFAGLSSLLLIVIIVFLPETKGKSFSEILKELDR